mgnify:CR=1 FL=1
MCNMNVLFIFTLHRELLYIINVTLCFQFDFEDTFGPDTFSFHPEPNNNTSCDPPARQEDVHHESRSIIPVTVDENKVYCHALLLTVVYLM